LAQPPRDHVLHTVYCTAGTVASLQAEARRCFPREACGLLGGRRAGPDFVLTHFLPSCNRDPRTDHFTIDALEFARGEAELRQQGLAWLGFAHSHPGGEATPSAADRQLLWRGCVQVIVAMDAAGANACAAHWLGAGGLVVSLPMELLP
jgi:proteasome lid subunit RPN8/RPN11